VIEGDMGIFLDVAVVFQITKIARTLIFSSIRGINKGCDQDSEYNYRLRNHLKAT